MKKSSVKNNEKQKQINSFRIAFIRCACESELLVVKYDGEIDSVELSIYENQQSFKNKMSFWQKIRYVYNLFKTGQPFSDQIILERQQIEELSSFLNSL